MRLGLTNGDVAQVDLIEHSRERIKGKIYSHSTSKTTHAAATSALRKEGKDNKASKWTSYLQPTSLKLLLGVT